MAGKDPIRITHLITDSGAGGAEKILYELATRLDRDRFQVKVLAMKRPGATFDRLVEAGVPCLSLDLPADVGAGYLAKLPLAASKLIRELKADRLHVLHCWLFQANLLGRLAARLAGVPANLSSLRVMEMERASHYPLDRLTKSMVTKHIAVCDAVARHAEAKLGFPADSIEVIRNGVDAGPYLDASGAALRAELGVSADAKVIGVAGRLHRQKGVDVLIEATAALAGKFPELRVLVAGDGPLLEELRERARSSGVAHAISFLGEWRRMPEFMAAIDVFVLPSRWEGMPNAALEAMAAARPVVATRVGGTPELALDGVTGALVEPEDPKALAEAIAAFLDDPDRAGRMGAAGRERVMDHYTIEGMVDMYAELYESLYSEYVRG